MFSVIVCVQWYLVKRTIRWINGKNIHRKWKTPLNSLIAGGIIFLNLPLFYTFTADMPTKPLSPFLMATIVYPYVIWGSSYVLIFLILKFFDILRFISSKTIRKTILPKKGKNTHLMGRRRFISLATKTAVLSPIMVSGYGVVLERDNFSVKETSIKVNNIPESLKSLRIAHISDIHAGVFMGKKEISDWTKIISESKPDILFITGDFVATSRDSVSSCIEGLRHLHSMMPVYCCLGNHDYWGNEMELTRELKSTGVNVFRNGNEVIDFRGNQINLCGVEDMRMATPDLQKALKGIDKDKLTILLAHNPNYFDYAKTFPIYLTLSGHTHGGQININLPGINISPARLITKYVKGAFKEGNSHLYVTPGVGTIGFPLRINVPPEISVIKFI